MAETRKDMDRELGQMVRAYRHPGRNLGEILECMAVAHADGVDVSEAFGRLLDEIAAANRRAA